MPVAGLRPLLVLPGVASAVVERIVACVGGHGVRPEVFGVWALVMVARVGL